MTSQEEEAEGREEEDLQPTFIRKDKRATIISVNESQHISDHGAIQRIRAEVLSKCQSVLDEEIKIDNIDHDIGLPDLDSLINNEEVEFHAWKVRELNRLNREQIEKIQLAEERDQLRARRKLTDDEILSTEQRNIPEKQKPSWKFMQKYYHKGVFYMDNSSIKDTADVRTKEYSEPTLEDKIDKEKLPKVLQVKNFGKKGRTKYTHLVDQDTTLQENKRVAYKVDQRVFDSITKRRKL